MIQVTQAFLLSQENQIKKLVLFIVGGSENVLAIPEMHPFNMSVVVIWTHLPMKNITDIVDFQCLSWLTAVSLVNIIELNKV